MKRKFAYAVLILACSNDWAFSLPYFGRTPGNKLTAADAQDEDEFGRSVAVAGGNFLLGAPGEDGTGASRGAAYLFNASSGAQLRKLTASDAADDDGFGFAVALSSRHAVIGAPGQDLGGTDRGAVYVFDLQTGAETFKLVPSVSEDSSAFGASIAVSGDFVIVGAFLENASGTDRGAVYVFDLTTGAERFRLTAADSVDGDSFGVSVDLSGNLALVGAPLQNGQRGAAYAFDLATGTQIHKFAPSELAVPDAFGLAVAVAGSTAVIGAPRTAEGGSFRGSVYVFDLITGSQKHKLTASDAANNDVFGSDVAISGDLVLSGAYAKNGSNGALYAFDLSTGGELAKLTTADAVPNGMSFSLGLDGRLALAGAPFDGGGGSERGAAYVFEIPDRQPDLLSGTAPASGVGRGVYNTSAAGQTLVLTSNKLAQVSGYLTVTNSGDTGDDFDLSATAGNGDFAVTYLRRTGSTESNITAALIAGTHEEPNVVPDDAGRVIRALVKPSTRLKKKKKGKTTYLRRTFVARVTATSATHDFKSDAAAVQVQTR